MRHDQHGDCQAASVGHRYSTVTMRIQGFCSLGWEGPWRAFWGEAHRDLKNHAPALASEGWPAPALDGASTLEA